MIRQSIQWTPEAFAVADEVLALGLPSFETLAKIAERFGVPYLSDNQLRNAYSRRGKRISYGRQAPTSEPAPSTQRSERVPSLLPPQPAQPVTPPGQWRSAADEVPCRQFVAPKAPREPGPEDHELVLVIPDIHFGAHDERAVDTALAIGAAMKPTAIVVLGDALDGAALSTHDKSSGVASLMDEVEAARPFFRGLEQLGARFLGICLGNHEFRLDRFLHTQASAIADVPGLSVDALLGLSEHNWRVTPYHEGFDLGPVHYTHDVGFCGIGAVRQSLLRWGSSIVIGHVHTKTIIELSKPDGSPLIGGSFGCLLRHGGVNYRNVSMARREWPHGVGLVTGGENGYHAMRSISIREQGRVAYYNGRAVRAVAA